MRKFRILVSSLVSLGLIVIIALGCNKGNTTSVKPAVQGFKATIVNTGDIAADGCGWLVKIDSNYYHADNLPATFQRDQLNVAINYNRSSSTFQCGMDPNNQLPVIHINDIENR